MKVYVKSNKGLRHLNEDMWEDIFIDSIEGSSNIVNVNLIDVNEDTIIPTHNTKGANAIKEIKDCVMLESLEKEVYEITLNLELEESFYDKDDNLLHAEVIANEDSDLEVKFYYEVGNFLKTAEEKKRYSEVEKAY